MKICSVCKIQKDETEFTRDKTTSSGLYTACKVCKRARDVRQHEVHRQQRNAYYKARQQQVTLIVSNIKRSKGCQLCSEREPVCLEFHHLDPTKKDFSISARPNMNVETILLEIEKCVVLCSNCHKKVHAGILVLS